jgi:hypothetical protein
VANSQQVQCANAVMSIIQNLTLPDNGRILNTSTGLNQCYLLPMFEVDNITKPCFIIHYASIPPIDIGHNNVTNDIGYGVGVVLVDAQPVNYQDTRNDDRMAWVETVRTAFTDQRLPPVTQVYRCKVERGMPFDPRWGQYEVVYTADIIRCYYRASRLN